MMDAPRRVGAALSLPSRTGVHRIASLMPPVFAARTVSKGAAHNSKEGNQRACTEQSERGQAMAEFALVMPLLVALLFGLVMAGFYAYRAASADWGVFITGVASGSYNNPTTEQARASVVWPDIRSRIAAGQVAPRQVRSQITIEDSRPWILGINLIEAHRGSAYFRLWRFYPGPPPPGGFE